MQGFSVEEGLSFQEKLAWDLVTEWDMRLAAQISQSAQ
jgi:hypothetical protein